MATVKTGQPTEIKLVALRPFWHKGEVVAIADQVTLETGQARHLIACKKALEANEEGLKLAAEAKAADVKAKAEAARLAAQVSAKSAGVDPKVLAEMEARIRKEVEAGQAEAIKKAVAEALAAKK